MFSFTKKSFSFKVYITGNREFLPRKPQIYLIHSSKLQGKFSVSPVKYKNHSVGYIFHSVGYKSRNVKQRIDKDI